MISSNPIFKQIFFHMNRFQYFKTVFKRCLQQLILCIFLSHIKKRARRTGYFGMGALYIAFVLDHWCPSTVNGLSEDDEWFCGSPWNHHSRECTTEERVELQLAFGRGEGDSPHRWRDAEGAAGVRPTRYSPLLSCQLKEINPAGTSTSSSTSAALSG